MHHGWPLQWLILDTCPKLGGVDPPGGAANVMCWSPGGILRDVLAAMLAVASVSVVGWSRGVQRVRERRGRMVTLTAARVVAVSVALAAAGVAAAVGVAKLADASGALALLAPHILPGTPASTAPTLIIVPPPCTISVAQAGWAVVRVALALSVALLGPSLWGVFWTETPPFVRLAIASNLGREREREAEHERERERERERRGDAGNELSGWHRTVVGGPVTERALAAFLIVRMPHVPTPSTPATLSLRRPLSRVVHLLLAPSLTTKPALAALLSLPLSLLAPASSPPPPPPASPSSRLRSCCWSYLLHLSRSSLTAHRAGRPATLLEPDGSLASSALSSALLMSPSISAGADVSAATFALVGESVSEELARLSVDMVEGAVRRMSAALCLSLDSTSLPFPGFEPLAPSFAMSLSTLLPGAATQLLEGTRRERAREVEQALAVAPAATKAQLSLCLVALTRLAPLSLSNLLNFALDNADEVAFSLETIVNLSCLRRGRGATISNARTTAPPDAEQISALLALSVSLANTASLFRRHVAVGLLPKSHGGVHPSQGGAISADFGTIPLPWSCEPHHDARLALLEETASTCIGLLWDTFSDACPKLDAVTMAGVRQTTETMLD
eukprot:CAMPEP_0170750716 /NCGR_PEP_ID=MMETSP0437-20130122/11075_1 /TAXON_ID=0 /ORGANISM="Sexangularia sp." /LENGTH=619 /DNA_ID=CAMNT_0011089721 /DNA_START=497 /DNA_END=2356 /DNA_ORIENTATION=+